MKPPKLQESRLSKRGKNPIVSAATAVKDMLTPKNPLDGGGQESVTAASAKKPKTRYVERTFRLDPTQIRALAKVRDRFNADRPDDTPAVSLDEIARLMSQFFLEQKKPGDLIDRLRGSDN